MADTATTNAAATDQAQEPPRQTISISLKKKKRSTATSKPTLSEPLQLTEEYSTIAQQAESISKKRKEDGEVLVIPCAQSKPGDGEGPLLARRSEALAAKERKAEEAQQNDDAAKQPEEEGVEDDIEATLQLIQSATHRDGTDPQKKSNLTISAPSKNKLNNRSLAAAQATTTDEELFQRDLSSRAEDVDPTSSTYANVSIGDFGGALLRGMGWTGGDTNGGKEEEIKARPHRLGLGATPMLPPAASKSNGLVRRARRPEEIKKEEERQRLEEERERKRLEKERLDVQFTLQNGSVVKIDEGRKRAKVVQTAGVPGLNRILVRMEDGERDVAVNKGSVELCSWTELEGDPFRLKDGGKKMNAPVIKYHGEFKDEDGGRRKVSGKKDDHSDDDGRYKRRRKDSSRDDSDDDSHSRRRRKDSSQDKHYSEDDGHRKRRRKESSRDKHYSSDDDSHYKRRRKESSRDKHGRKRDRSEERDSSRSRTKHRDRNRDDDRRNDRNGHSKRSRRSPSPQNDKEQHHLNWLLPNIRVRLVSKKYPRQHLQKGIVQDVISSKNNPKAVLLMDNQEVLDNIPERYLETALPKTGGNVIVLEGCHRWKKGRLLERSSEKGKGVIQLFEDLEVVEVSLDGIVEWCGPVDEDLG